MDRARKNTSHRLVAWRHKLRYQIRWSGFLHWKNCLQQFGSTLASEASSGPKPPGRPVAWYHIAPRRPPGLTRLENSVARSEGSGSFTCKEKHLSRPSCLATSNFGHGSEGAGLLQSTVNWLRKKHLASPCCPCHP